MIEVKDVSSYEFVKYDPVAHTTINSSLITKRKSINELLEAISKDLVKTDIYTEDPEFPRYILTLHTSNEGEIKVKVVNNFVIRKKNYYYSPSKILWETLEKLSQKKSLLGNLFKDKEKKLHIEGDNPCFR